MATDMQALYRITQLEARNRTLVNENYELREQLRRLSLRNDTLMRLAQDLRDDVMAQNTIYIGKAS